MEDREEERGDVGRENIFVEKREKESITAYRKKPIGT